ncbi:amino acid ABC transporter substrate-binding protein [Planosporangium thailandense]|uniref:Amino acid ABC transporter substrate-binding protein n=1 Tax=Planosporangium thailandense TaxID=765197 RepID=A0ABX0XXJ0_9ACTN|nr:ABC transporter substrate-binding protein [Planosporangium thailandense]NJC70556.1 amino acid ABC transporter substrate-binding protein [Planosporangium thailandense]
MSRRSLMLALPAALLLTGGLAACGGGGGSDKSSAADSGCKPAHTFSTLEKGKLTVSVYVSPPYSEQKGTTFGGVDGAIINALAKKECLELKANPVSGAALIASVQSKRADLGVGGVYRTAEREKLLNLSDTMYRDGMALLSKKDVSDLASLKGKTVGVVQGYLWNAELQKALGTDSVKIYQASDGMVNDLANGRLDAGVLTTAEAGYRAAQNKSANLKVTNFAPDPAVPSSQQPGQVVLAETKGNTAMTQAFDEDIKAMIQDGTIGGFLKDNNMSESLAGNA